MGHRLVSLGLLVMALHAVVSDSDDWTSQCNKCKCSWYGGRKRADCVNMSLSEIPADLSPDIRDIDFSKNALYSLGREALYNVGLKDIHKLKFQNCSIEQVDKAAFKGLQLLIELDLSGNMIAKLDRQTFKENLKLRVLTLSSNRLVKLENGLFYNMTHLQKIMLDSNDIQTIESRVFNILPALQFINLAYNKLTKITSDFTSNLPKLNSLNIEGNPWHCDCLLEDFRNKTIKENLITARTECAEPPRLRGRSWTENVIFACLPEIIEPLPSTHIEATSSNVTLTCRVKGEPQPDVDWVLNGRIIDSKDARQSTQRFITSKQKEGYYTWNNLTITNVNYRDKGEYKCVAKNPGGVDEQNVSLIVTASGGYGGAAIPLGSALPLVIGLSVGALVVLVVILILICCCCKRNTHGMNAKRGDLIQNSSDECIRLHGQPEMEKALITDVNPVIKPPRVSSVPPSVNSGGTQVSEAKRNLLDSDSIFAGDDESHSLDYELQSLRKSQNLLDPDYRGNPYPPDLLPPYPPRMCQVSPAGSLASTVIVADASRLPTHYGPQSPLQSPVYDHMSLYRTLPYSRSQSPFVGPSARIPRQGYVTIPRRPRQSWSSEPPGLSDIGEPLYDNLGLRTTAGGSCYSLNKDAGETTPKSPRALPLSPNFCDTIAEDLSVATAPSIGTLSRTMESTNNKLSPSRTNWARANAEALRSPENRRNSMPNDGNKIKIAPVPPPKPKKRTSTGPLVEDEGEDGTEV